MTTTPGRSGSAAADLFAMQISTCATSCIARAAFTTRATVCKLRRACSTMSCPAISLFASTGPCCDEQPPRTQQVHAIALAQRVDFSAENAGVAEHAVQRRTGAHLAHARLHLSEPGWSGSSTWRIKASATTSNYVLMVHARNLDPYSDFVINRLHRLPSILSITSNIVLSTLKPEGSILTPRTRCPEFAPVRGRHAGALRTTAAREPVAISMIDAPARPLAMCLSAWPANRWPVSAQICQSSVSKTLARA